MIFQTGGLSTDHCPSGNWAQCVHGGETGMAGHPFTRGQHHANKIALNLCNFGLTRWEHPKNFTPWATWRRKMSVCTGKGFAPPAADLPEKPNRHCRERPNWMQGATSAFGLGKAPGETCPGLVRPSSSGLQEGDGCLQHLEAISERLRCPADARQGERSSLAQAGGPGGG